MKFVIEVKKKIYFTIIVLQLIFVKKKNEIQVN